MNSHHIISKSTLILFFLSIMLVYPVSGVLESFPVIPAECYGNVTIDGIPAPAGTTITAIMQDTILGSIVINTSGQYGGFGPFGERLYIFPPDNLLSDEELHADNVVSFLIDSLPAYETLIYDPGTCNHLSLSAYAPDTIPDEETIRYQNTARTGSIITICRVPTEETVVSVAMIPVIHTMMS